MRIHIYIWLSVLLFICTCSTEKKEEDHRIVDIATLKGPSAISMLKMLDDQLYVDNMKINVTIYNEPQQIKALMIENRVDFCILPTTSAALYYNKGIQYKVCAIPVWGTLFLLGKDTTVNIWSDLKGKKVYLMAKGMTPDVLFRMLLNKENLTDHVITDYSFPTHIDLANATAAGLTDLVVLSEPFVSMTAKKNEKMRIIYDLSDEWKNKYDDIPFALTAFMVNADFAEKYPEEVEKVLGLYKESIDWVNTNNKAAAGKIVRAGILNDAGVAENVIPNCNLNYQDSYAIRNDILRYLEVFYNFNPQIIGGKLPDEDFFFKK